MIAYRLIYRPLGDKEKNHILAVFPDMREVQQEIMRRVYAEDSTPSDYAVEETVVCFEAIRMHLTDGGISIFSYGLFDSPEEAMARVADEAKNCPDKDGTYFNVSVVPTPEDYPFVSEIRIFVATASEVLNEEQEDDDEEI